MLCGSGSCGEDPGCLVTISAVHSAEGDGGGCVMASTFSETATQHEADPLGQLQMEAGVGSQGMFAEDLKYPPPGYIGGEIWLPCPYFCPF